MKGHYVPMMKEINCIVTEQDNFQGETHFSRYLNEWYKWVLQTKSIIKQNYFVKYFPKVFFAHYKTNRNSKTMQTNYLRGI